MIATLRAQHDALQYEIFDNYLRFCDTTTCPFEGNTSFTYQFNISDAYQGISFTSKFVILNSAEISNVLGCIRIETTPILKSYSWYPLVIGIFCIALFVGFTYLLTAYLNPWTGTKNVYIYSSNFGKDPSVIRLITPGFFDVVKYLQFAVFLSSLSLNYPGFLQPIVSTASWSCLLFSSSLVSSSGTLPDGLYSPSASYGLERISQVNQIARVDNIWSGFIIYLLLLTAGIFLLCELVAGITWVWRKYRDFSSDLRIQNPSFLLGLVFRIYLNLFAFPFLTFSLFQCVVTKRGPTYLTSLAALSIAAWIIAMAWVSLTLYYSKSKQALYDDLPTMLRYGTFFSTYQEQGMMFFLVEFAATFMRSVAVGAVQSSGLAQIIILAIIELVYFLCIFKFQPFDRETSMNLITALFSVLRFVLIFLSLPFLTSLNVDIVVREWLGYVILVLHALVILLFLMHGIQVVVEVLLRYNGVANDNMTGAIFSLKQLSKRRQTEATAPMLDPKQTMTQKRFSHKPGSSIENRGLLGRENSIGRHNMVTPNTDTSYNPESMFDDAYVPSPTSEQGFITYNQDSAGYYRKPRQRSSIDPPNITAMLQEGKQASNADVPENGPLVDNLRRGIVSPPPAGVDYAVRESDIYYTQRAKPKKKKRRPESEFGPSMEALEDEDEDEFATYTPEPSDSNKYSDYGPRNDTGPGAAAGYTANPRRSRNANSMVGGFMDQESPSLTYNPDYDVELVDAPTSAPAGSNSLFGWFKNKRQQLFGKGYEEPSIEPRGFEVFRRGPIRGKQSFDSRTETEIINANVQEVEGQVPSLPQRSHKRISSKNSPESNGLLSESYPLHQFDAAGREGGDTVPPQIPVRSPRASTVLKPTIIHRREASDSLVETSAGTFVFPTSPSTASGMPSNPGAPVKLPGAPSTEEYYGHILEQSKNRPTSP